MYLFLAISYVNGFSERPKWHPSTKKEPSSSRSPFLFTNSTGPVFYYNYSTRLFLLSKMKSGSLGSGIGNKRHLLMVCFLPNLLHVFMITHCYGFSKSSISTLLISEVPPNLYKKRSFIMIRPGAHVPSFKGGNICQLPVCTSNISQVLALSGPCQDPTTIIYLFFHLKIPCASR